MSLREKILLYFSIIPITIIGMAFIFIYTLFSKYREVEFHQVQNEKIHFTVKFLSQIRKIDEKYIETLEPNTIYNLFDEKLLIFDDNKVIIYSSIDDTQIPLSTQILNSLSAKKPLVEQKDGLYDVIGIFLTFDNRNYYSICKAYDASGYSKLNYLKYVLLISFITVSIILIIISIFLSRKITYSILHITRQIRDFDFTKNDKPITLSGSKDEIALLANRFNELMKRMNDAFLFQKHAIQHFSHELKTPIAVLVSNFERIEEETDLRKIKQLITQQKEDTKSLGEIINSLLEISKVESGTTMELSKIRIDELIYDLTDELNSLHPDFLFSIEYDLQKEEESLLTILANPRLIRAAILNLMLNSAQYSTNNKARIIITNELNNLKLLFINDGNLLTPKEQQYLFQHFFRGENSQGKRGFGLGLVFVYKILVLTGGKISYSVDNNLNTFIITIPLS
jgi:signal transduction histidine kinase